MTRLRVSEQIFEMFPDAIIGVVSFQSIKNVGENAEVMMGLWREEARVVERFAGQSVSDHPHIAPWREAYRKFGARPKDHLSSIENLVRRSIKKQAIRHINLVVDIYNTISLRHVLPVGGEDLEQVQGDIHLTFAGENETPVQLLGEKESRPPKPGEVIYKDEIGAICRRWNWKEAERTKFTDTTTRGLFVVEGLPPVQQSMVKHAIDELAALVQTYCGGTAKTGIINAGKLSMTLD